MKVVFWGTPSYAVESLLAIIKEGHEIEAVVTQPDRKRGRGKKLSPSPIKTAALNRNIKVFTPTNIRKDKETTREILNINADIYIVVAFGQILPKEILNQPKLGCWNSHGSLLPNWRGAAPIQWCILNGQKKTGVGIMFMEETLDTGPIINEESICIGLNENYESLSCRLSKLSAKLLTESLSMINNTYEMSKEDRLKHLKAIYQSERNEKATYARQITKEDYIIDWRNQSIEIHRKVMALYPNAYSLINKKRLKFLKTKPLRKEYFKDELGLYEQIIENLGKRNIKTGEIFQIQGISLLFIMCVDVPLVLFIGQLEGKKRCDSNVLRNQLNLIDDLVLGS